MTRLVRLFAPAVGVALGTCVTMSSLAQTIDLNRIFSIGRDAVTAVTGVSEEEELAMGREIAGRMLGAAPLVNDEELQRYVNRVGRWVAMQSERPGLPWRFAVIDTTSINAFATPGGYVLLTRGLYDILDNEAQLAGVLAHEIGHIVQRHHVTVLQKSAALSAGAQLAQRDNRSALVNNMIGSGAEVFARGLDKSAEYEADAIGLVLAARAGYNPFGLIDVLHKLAARGASDGSLALLFKTHPPPGDRLEHLGEALTPHMARLPAGKNPDIRVIAAGAGPMRASQPLPAEGARGLTAQPQQKPKSESGGVDPSQLLRGLFGR
ncbi:MAG: M48 family metallopeptidase [Betaproteobacteria bacterium]|jgi:predicted Zn-dependent protease|nr:M48 family metallopeptidase [Betaproteobacteria bacterium]